MARVLGAVLLVLLAGGALELAGAIHADQLGRFDWHRPFLGAYNSALFAKKPARVVVSSDRNALSVMSLRTGEVEWRQVFGEDDTLHKVVMTNKPAALFTLSGERQAQMLRAWNQHSGALVWDMPLCSPEEAAQPIVYGGSMVHMGPEQTNELNRALVFVTACGELKAVNTSTVDVTWTYPFVAGAEMVKLTMFPMSASVGVLSAFSSRADLFVEVALLSAVDGSVSKKVKLAVPDGVTDVDPSQVALVKGTVVALVSGGSQICSAAVEQDAIFTCKETQQVVGAAAVSLSASQPFSTVVLETQDEGRKTGHVLLSPVRGDDSRMQKVKAFPGSSATGVMLLEGGGEVIGVAGASGQDVWWAVHDAATGEELHREGIQEFRKWGREAIGGAGTTDIARCFLATYGKKDGSSGWRMLVVSSDSSAVLLQQGEVVWVREEALSGITSSLALDFPTKTGGLEGSVSLTSMQHLRKQILTLKTQMGIASAVEAAELTELRHLGSNIMLTTPDSSGFRKLLIVLTDTGKLLALHNGDGHVVWGLAYSPDIVPQALHMWQEPHSLTVSPKVVVVCKDTTTGGTYASIVDAHSGKEFSSMGLAQPTRQILKLPVTYRVEGAEQQLFLLTTGSDGEAAAQLLPPTEEAAVAFAPHAGTTTFWALQNGNAPSIQGYSLVPTQLSKSTFDSMVIWSISLGAPVLSTAERSDSYVHSRIKVLGDRSMMVRYLNRNTLFLAVGSSDSVDEDSEITVHVIDTASGRHLFRQTHKGASGPVVSVFCENWIVYHYWSTWSLRHEMSVIELYDDSTAKGASLADSVLSNSSTAISSYTPVAIKALRQSFYFSQGVKFMAVTNTAGGITSRQILLGTSSNQVYGMDKRFLDPRRPLGTPTQAEKEERLMPYKADLGVHPPFFTTYDKIVQDVRGAQTFPTNLESTTLMLAYGMDVFYTRLSPSKSFDMLDDDFSYALLVATLLAMAGIAAYLQMTKRRNELAKKWA